MKRRIRILKIASMLSVGAYVMQINNCITGGINTALAATPFGTILTDLGFPGVCGTPNFIVVDENGIPTGEVQNTEDDLVYFCPVTQIVDVQDGGDGGDGG
ncbi:MAG: hypothetical protein DCC65_06075 [Planctomycetota bacterium]|nr:MAG: hypothetical protein DCC65_06075 [Planctomycetota bacterium]